MNLIETFGYNMKGFNYMFLNIKEVFYNYIFYLVYRFERIGAYIKKNNAIER